MSVPELEQRTCRAYCLASRWLSGHLNSPRTLYIDSLHVPVSDVKFLPGRCGEWILTVSKGIWDVLTIWDLRSSDKNETRKTCEWSLRGALFNGIALNTDPGSDATLAVSVSNDGEQMIHLLLLRSDQNGGLSIQTTVTISSSMKPTKLEGDLLAVSDEVSQTVVWNWRARTSAILKQPDGEAGLWQPNRIIQVVFANQSVLVIRACSIHLFPYPELQEMPLTYTPIAQHSFGWIDGVCVTPTRTLTPSLSILLRGESDDPWTSGQHSLNHYTLLPNLNAATDQDVRPSPYIFPPALIAKVPAVRGTLRCRNVVLGPCGTAAWIQPQDRAVVGLTWTSDEGYPLQAIHSISGKESLMLAAFPGPLTRDGEGWKQDDVGIDVAGIRSTAVFTNELNNWTALDYDEEVGPTHPHHQLSGNRRIILVAYSQRTLIFYFGAVMIQLPVDLIDEVVHHLRGDVETLSQCCQVSHAFLIPSRKALFTIIRFDRAVYSSGLTTSPDYPYDDSKLRETQKRWKLFYAFLIANPQYISCIEELWLNGLTWAIKENTFPALLVRLEESKNLRVLSLAFSVGTLEGWSVLPMAISEPLTALFRSPYLHTLRIHITDRCACTIPPNVFAAVAPTLKRLYVGGESIYSVISGSWCPHLYPVDPPRPILREKPVKLEVLEIGCHDTPRFRDFLLGPYSPFDLSNVKVVTIRGWSDPDGLSDIIKLVERSIESLVWFHPRARNGSFVESTQLWSMKRLCSLTLIMAEQHHVDTVFKFLGRGAIPDSLTCITMYIDDDVGTLRSDSCQSSIDRKLGDLITIFGRRDVRIVMLRRVTMLNERSLAMMKNYFPQLSKKARLAVVEEDMLTFEKNIRALVSGS
ncbi:hypothetical protein E4T56_gene9917 [Termitomyces sp. T112]|nr:hypothetical protein E4T56_gene9917 [Termitomyces sp. T112]